jgi:hypothetical protein
MLGNIPPTAKHHILHPWIEQYEKLPVGNNYWHEEMMFYSDTL